MVNAQSSDLAVSAVDRSTAVAAGNGFSRRLWLSDAPAMCAHFSRLSPADRYQRFAQHIDDAGIEKFCRQLSWLNTIMIGHFLDGELRGVGELRLSGLRPPLIAELAISVERDFQNRGIGTELFQRLVVLARNRRVRTIHMQCLMDNIRLRRIAGKFGAQIEMDFGEVSGLLELRRPSLSSWLDEASAESLAAMGLMFQLRPRGTPRTS
jgi:RimJ/RimL family protein N-acetyltransferase